MPQYNTHEAKTHLSQLVERAGRGEEVVIAKAGEPLVRLVAINQPAHGRRFGAMRGKAAVGPAFFEPLPEDELDGWAS